MMRKMTEEELKKHKELLENSGAIGRNATICKCGHIDYFPNSDMIKNCVIYVHNCIECKDN